MINDITFRTCLSEFSSNKIGISSLRGWTENSILKSDFLTIGDRFQVFMDEKFFVLLLNLFDDLSIKSAIE